MVRFTGALARTRSEYGALVALIVATVSLRASADEPPPIKPLPVAPAPSAAGGSISLADAVRRATTQNPAMAIALEEIHRAEALTQEARAGWFPTLTGNGVFTRLDSERDLSGRTLTPVNQLTANLSLNVPIVATKQWFLHSRAKENVDITRTSAVDTRRTLAVAAARTYLTVIAQHRVLESAQRAFINAKAHEDYAKSRFTGGVGNRLDSVRASEERATADARVKTQLVALARAEEALGVVVGSDLALDAAEEPWLQAPTDVSHAIDQAATRPDVVAQRQRIASAHNAVRESWYDYVPVLAGVAAPFYTDPATSTLPQTGWQAQLILAIPFYDGGFRYGAREERLSLEAEAKSKLDQALRQLRSDVRIAFDAVRLADEALAGAREAAQLSREARELAELAYRAGASTNIEVIDAERNAVDTEISAAVAEDAARQARLDLLDATGRFPGPP
jgi:outer membrane protein TolC